MDTQDAAGDTLQRLPSPLQWLNEAGRRLHLGDLDRHEAALFVVRGIYTTLIQCPYFHGHQQI